MLSRMILGMKMILVQMSASAISRVHSNLETRRKKWTAYENSIFSLPFPLIRTRLDVNLRARAI